MRRKLMERLLQWKDHKNRKPLILWGARQTGKTWILKEFGRSAFSDTVYISFYNNTRIASIFERDYDVHRILNAPCLALRCMKEYHFPLVKLMS